jgi:hypothetical protein
VKQFGLTLLLKAVVIHSAVAAPAVVKLKCINQVIKNMIYGGAITLMNLLANVGYTKPVPMVVEHIR